MTTTNNPTRAHATVRAVAKGLALGVVALALSACAGGDMNDLREYTDDVKARPGGRVKSLPDVPVFEPFVYRPRERRDPFRHSERAMAPHQTDEIDGVKPNMDRRREELEAFPLDSLRMVGTLEQTQDIWGVVRNNEGIVFRVQVGDYMGLNHGQITRVTEDGITLTEIVANDRGAWHERSANVALAE